MTEQQITRRLAAILTADVAGYSSMMGTDEGGTIAALRHIWSETFNPTVAAHHGRIVKMMGDGALVEFGSVVEAVECAVAIQRAMGERNLTARRPVEFRIGINLGEIVIEGGDIFGDGVNVATRLEGQAPKGGILVSDVVHTQVSGKVGVTFIDSGEIKLKNIDRPLRVWRWGGNETAPLSRPMSSFIASATDDKPSIAVLPFDNLSGDPEQGYFADGITEDIITDLSKVSGLFVIARNSSFAYKGQASDIRKVSRELGVRYVLEGSVRRAAGRIRINAQMIDATTGGHLWADRYDRDLVDIFAVQDELTRTIVDALKVKLTADEQTRRMALRKANPEAYDLLIRASQNILQFRPEALIEGRAMLQRAIDLDPGLAVAYARLSIIHSVEYANQWNAGLDHLKEALDLAGKAIESDENEPKAYDALAIALLWSRRLDEGERAAERMIQLDPNYANGYVELGNARHYKGGHESAVELYKQAHRLDPQFDLTLHFLGRALFALGRFDEAEATFKRRLALVPRSDMTRFYLACLYGHMGRHDEARQVWRELLEVKPNFSVDHFKRILPYQDPALFDWFVDGIRKAGIAF